MPLPFALILLVTDFETGQKWGVERLTLNICMQLQHTTEVQRQFLHSTPSLPSSKMQSE